MSILKLPIYKDIFLKSLWFSFTSSSQTYRRTQKSAGDAILHFKRIFIGKLGELSFIRWAFDNQLIDKEEFGRYEKDSLSIYYGIRNVDSFDLKIANESIDIKTAAKVTYKFLIVPEDQWKNQKKDIYVGLALWCKEDFCGVNSKLDKTCKDLVIEFMGLYDSLMTKETMPDMEVWLFGFLGKESPKWEYHQRDRICPEKACYRVRLNDLEPIENLKSYIGI